MRLQTLLLITVIFVPCSYAAEEPTAFNPFAPKIQEPRDDAVAGYLEMSDGVIHVGRFYLTKDKRLELYDSNVKRQRQIPLNVLKSIDCEIEKEFYEKEWRFKELASNEKYYTGREYPAREYVHTLTLKDSRKILGPLSGIVYMESLDEKEKSEPAKFLLHKRDKGEYGTKLRDLKYVKSIHFGDEAVEIGKTKQKKR